MNKTELTQNQQFYAEWLSKPSFERDPRTQKALAEMMGVTEATLCNWKKLPEVMEHRSTVLSGSGQDLVPEAVGVLKGMLRSNSNQTMLKAAQEVLNRYGESSKSSLVITSLKDVWDKYDNIKITCPHCGKSIEL
jgi:hypothetical protein